MSTNSENLIKKIEEAYREGFYFYEFFLRKSIKNKLFAMGYQFSQRESLNASLINKKLISNNQIDVIIRRIIGDFINNPSKVETVPANAENEEELKISVELNSLFFKLRRESHLKREEISMLREMLIGGLSFIHFRIDFFNPSKIISEYIPLYQVIFDPSSKREDLSDCSYFFYNRIYSKFEAMNVFANKEDLIEENLGNIEKVFDYEAVNEFFRESSIDSYERNIANHRSQGKHLIVITELYTIENGVLEKIILIPTGKIEGRGFILLEKQKSPYGVLFNEMPFSMCFGQISTEFFNSANMKFQSLTDSIRPFQEALNRRTTQNHDIVESMHTGYVINTSDLVDSTQLLEAGRKFILTKGKKPPSESFSKMGEVSISPTLLELERHAKEGIFDAAGINNTAQNNINPNETFSLTLLKKYASSSSIAIFMYNFEETMKVNAIKILKMFASITENIQIIQALETLDLEITSTLETSPSKNKEFMALVQLQQSGINVDKNLLIATAPISSETKAKLFENIKQQEPQQQQQQQKIEQFQDAKITTDIEKVQSESMKNVAEAEKTQSETEKTGVETQKTAVEIEKTGLESQKIQAETQGKLIENIQNIVG